MIKLKEQLLKDVMLNKKEAASIALKACSSKEAFDDLMNCFLSNEYRVA